MEYIYAVTGNSLNLGESQVILLQMRQNLVHGFHNDNIQIEFKDVLAYLEQNYMDRALSLNSVGGYASYVLL